MPELKMELTGIEKAQRKYSRTVVRKATRSALNKTIKTAAVTSSKVIRRTYNLKKKDLDKKVMRISRAQINRQTATISVVGRPLSLAKFSARQLKKGTKVTIIRGRRTLLTHHFIATMKSGHVGVFKRLGKKSLPMAEPRMVSTPSMFSGVRVMPITLATIKRKWPKTFNNQLNFFFKKTA